MATSVMNLQEKNELQELDGIYLTRADVEMNSDNVRRLEQRLISSGDQNYFRTDNKELKIDNRLFDSKLFRRNDISIVKNSFQSFIKRNAVICERLNQKKKTYYPLEMFVGRLVIDKHQHFEEEDRLASTLKQQMRAYKEKVDKSLLPHYAEVLAEQIDTRDRLNVQPKSNSSDLALINKQIEDTQTKMKQEKGEMAECMLGLYETWKSIKSLRTSQGYDSTGVKLVVQEYTNDHDIAEQYLLLKETVTNDKTTYAGKSLPSAELTRRKTITSTSYFLRIYVNHELMAVTEKVAVQWPKMEIDFKELFQIFVYTKPYSISIEVCEGGLINHVIDTVEIDIPGELANSLTSAGTIIREVPYVKKRVLSRPKPQTKKQMPPVQSADSSKQPVSGLPPGTPGLNGASTPGMLPGIPLEDGNGDLFIKDLNGGPDQKHNKDQRPGSDNSRLRDDDINTEIPEDEYEDEPVPFDVLESGRLNIEVGWKGFGPKLPPLNTGGFGIFRQRKKEKNGYESLPQSESDLIKDEILVDVNDPRNNEYVEKVREIRNNYLRSLLKNDMKIPLNDVQSVRHQLMKLNLMDYDQKKKNIPLLEKEVVENEDLMRLVQHHYEEKRKMLQNNDIPESEKHQMEYAKNRPKAEPLPQLPETQKRINDTKIILFKKQGDIKLKKTLGVSDSNSLSQVVQEFRFGDHENNFIQSLMSIFEPRRKFRMSQRKPNKVAPNQRKECFINIQAIKGVNVPARTANQMKANRLTNVSQFNPGRTAGEIREQQRAMGQSMDLGSARYDPLMPLPQPKVDLAGGIPVMADDDGVANANENVLDQNNNYDLPSTLIQATIVDKVDFLVTSQENTRNTDTFDGVDPEWNESIALVYKPRDVQNGFSNIELLNNEAVLYITLFDFIGTWEDDVLNTQKKVIDIEKRFLGNIKIPLLNLFVTPKLDSMFKLNRPIYLIGYQSAKSGIFSTLLDDNSDNDKRAISSTHVDPFLPTYVMLSLSCDPQFDLAETDNTDYFPGAESTQLLLAGKSFLESIFDQQENKGRNIRLWGYNIEGKSVFIPRYLTPIKIPEGFSVKDPSTAIGEVPSGPGRIDSQDDAYQKCARFVSLIPLKGESEFFKDMPDIFMTCQEFLDMRAGDFEEHAILLCDYFMYIDQVLKNNTKVESMVVLGRGVPEGKTYYVLRRDSEKNVNEVWNPVTGDVYVFYQKKLISKILCFSYNAGTSQMSASMFSSKQLWTVSVL